MCSTQPLQKYLARSTNLRSLHYLNVTNPDRVNMLRAARSRCTPFTVYLACSASLRSWP